MAPPRILLVEDESIVALDIQGRLESMGYQVAGWLAAGDRVAAEIERTRPDLVLMDIRLQGVTDGIQAAQAIRWKFALPVVFLTAHADERTLQLAKVAEPFGFVLKPCNDAELRTAIEIGLYKFRAELAHRENEQWLKTILRSMRDAVVAADPAGRIRLLNAAGEQLTGWPLAEAQGRDLGDVVRVCDAAGRPVRFAAGGAQPGAELTLQPRSGNPLPVGVTAAPIHDEQGQQLGMLLMIRDQTEARRARTALAEERNLLRTLIDAFPDSIYIKDLGGYFIIGNQALANRIGVRNPGELIGKTDFDFYPRECAARFRDDEQRVLATGRPLINQEQSYVDAAGQVRWLLTSKVPFSSGAGQLIGLVGTGRDITERKRRQAEQERLDAGLREMQKLESVGVMAAGIAHDFNNLLMSIQGNAELAALHQPPSSAHYLQDVILTCRRAAELIQQLLAYAGKSPARMQPVSLSGLIREMLPLIRPLLGRMADLQLQLDEGLPPVEADATQVRQLVMNLVLNAAEALGEKPGVIRLETSRLRGVAPAVSPGGGSTALPAGDYAVILVGDNGCGMDAAAQARIFEPFFTTKFLGRGLGLSVVLGITRNHRGGIRVESEPGRGTRFQVFLPCHG